MTDLRDDLNQRAAANRNSLSERQEARKDKEKIATNNSKIVNVPGARRESSIKRSQVARFDEPIGASSIKNTGILYINIFDENNDAFYPPGYRYTDFTSNSLFKNAVTFCAVKIPGAEFYPPEGWDETLIELDNREAVGLYDAVAAATHPYPTTSNLADYSIILIAIDNSGSMNFDTVQLGMQEFIVKLQQNIRLRPRQLYSFDYFDPYDLYVTTPVDAITYQGYVPIIYPDTLTNLQKYLTYAPPLPYQPGVTTSNHSDYYLNRRATLIFIQSTAENIVEDLMDLLYDLTEDEIRFYTDPRRK